MDVLLLGVDSTVKSFLRKHVGADSVSKVRFYSPPLERDSVPKTGRWDVIVLDRKVKSHSQLADAIRKDHLQGLKIVLTEKENLRPSIEFWGPCIYSYFLKPVNPELLQLMWKEALGRIAINRRISRLEKQREAQRASVLGQKEILQDLFVTHLKLQERDQEKTNFLARTSHELRTPLTALQGYLELLAHRKAGEVNDLQSHLLDRSLDSCRRLLGLANSLMDLSALNGNSTQLQLECRDIQDCLSRAAAELSQSMEAKGLELRMASEGEIPKFPFDFDRLQQVFLNLLDNALKFTPSGGAVQVRCGPFFWDRRTVREMVYGSRERRGQATPASFNSVRISVEDTGAGIPAEFLQDIFEEYSRVGNGNGSPRGFGLGLAVARTIVLAHEGKIWAENRPGHGSTFTVLIPISL